MKSQDQEENNCFYAKEHKRTIWNKLFPSRWCELPDAPAVYQDCLHIEINMYLDWLDRLRILFTGCAIVKTKTVCKNTVGQAITASTFYIVRKFKDA